MKAIVLVLRGLHLGYLGCYGNEWINTPHLDRLAAEGIVFDQHFAGCPDATPSRRAWRSGLMQSSPASSHDLLALLRQSGVSCQLITSSPVAVGDFLEGWNNVCQVDSTNPAEEPLAPLMGATPEALGGLAAHKQALLWIEVANLLPPWSIPPAWVEAYFQPTSADEHEEEQSVNTEALEPLLDPAPGPLTAPEDVYFRRIQTTYAAAVSYVDSFVGWLSEELVDRNLADDSMLIVTTDHGQALGEHEIVGPYRPWLHDELIHIPLVMHLPKGLGSERRIAGLTESVDLYATLLDAFGVPVPSSHSYSLLPMARAETEAVRSHVCNSQRIGGREEWSLRTKEWAFLLPVAAPANDRFRGPQLYVKPDDRWEMNNVLQHHLELGERLEATLRQFMAAPRRIGLETPWLANTGGQAS